MSFQTRMFEAEAARDAAKVIAERKAILEKETTETEKLRKEAERQLIQAQVDAQAAKLAGFAEAEVMQAKGYNQKDVLQAEVQKAYAEGIGNMGSNGGGSGMMGDMVGLGVGLAAAGNIANQMGGLFQGLNVAPVAAAAPAQEETTTCPTCGKSLPANAKFCFECGSKIEKLDDSEMICPACGKKTRKGKFCMECGASLINKCPKCGAEVPQGGKFCLECGEKL